MATYGHTFTSGDTLTPTKLNAARTATDIVNADISASAAIALSKLATGALPTAITVASANLVDGTIVNADVSASAAIAHTKLANITAGQVLLGNASNAPTATALTGDVTINSSGVTAIGSGVLVNADINASAAIALSKLATGALPTAITVASANLVDGTIVNADINASAAIAGTKIAPDFGSQNVVTTGLEVIGGAAQPSGDFVYSSATSSTGARTTSVSAHSANNVSNAIVRYSNNTTSQTFAACLNLAKSNTQTAGSHVAVVDEQLLSSVGAFGSDGTNFVNSSSINFGVDGAVAVGSVPGNISFSTRAATSTAAPFTRMRITSAGNVGIANVSPTERLDVTGNIKASGVIDAGTSFRGQAGDSETAPSFTWTGDTDTGMLRPNADTIEFTVGGSAAMRINSAGAIGVGAGISAAALLDLTSTTRGLLPPRMTTAQRDAISTPPAGLMIYNTTTNKLNVRTASSWEAVTSA
jgi:hypothetical protein